MPALGTLRQASLGYLGRPALGNPKLVTLKPLLKTKSNVSGVSQQVRLSNFKVKIKLLATSPHGCGAPSGRERRRTGSCDSRSPRVGLECRLLRPLVPQTPKFQRRGGGGEWPAQIQGTIASLKHPTARPRGTCRGCPSVREAARGAALAPRALPAAGTKFRKREKVFQGSAPAVVPLPERRAPPAQAQAAPGSRPSPTL